MAFSRRLGVIGILSVSWFVAVACSDDEKNGANAGAGEAGEAGEASGGKSTSGGSANNAGKAGNATAGKGGMSTTGGTPTGGSGGNAGSAVTGGAGAGAVGGEDAGGAGGGPGLGGVGAGGASAGAGGTDEGGAGGVPAATVKSCGNQCEIDADCNIPDVIGQKCDQVSHRCYDSTEATCQTNDDCIPGGSFWSVPCATDAECADDDSESCVAVAGVGWCAVLAVAGECAMGEAKDLPRQGAQGESKVCVAYDRCQAGVCRYNCADPLFGSPCEGAGDGDSCNAVTGMCECTLGTECNSGVCGGDKQCAECTTNEECSEAGPLSGWDVCVNGKCGCSSTSVCPDQTAAATPVCE